MNEDRLEDAAEDPQDRRDAKILEAARAVAADVRELRKERDQALEDLDACRRKLGEYEEEHDLLHALDGLAPAAAATIPPGEHGEGLCVPAAVGRRGMNPAGHLLLALGLGTLYVFILPLFLPGAESVPVLRVLSYAVLFLLLGAGVTFLLSYGRRKLHATQQPKPSS